MNNEVKVNEITNKDFNKSVNDQMPSRTLLKSVINGRDIQESKCGIYVEELELELELDEGGTKNIKPS